MHEIGHSRRAVMTWMGRALPTGIGMPAKLIYLIDDDIRIIFAENILQLTEWLPLQDSSEGMRIGKDGSDDNCYLFIVLITLVFSPVLSYIWATE
jgi:hypothetical protein